MTTIPTIRSIKHGLPYNAPSIRSSLTMVTMITTLTILGKSNWNKTEIYPMLYGIGVSIVVVVVCMSFPQTLAKVCGCVFGVWVFGGGHFLEHWCVCMWSEFFVSYVSQVLRHFRVYIFV